MRFAVHPDNRKPIPKDAKSRAYVMFSQNTAPAEAPKLAQFYYHTIMMNYKDRRSQASIVACRHTAS